ncbi:poly-gamma-glutamate biosynthesis protein [Asanoa iriomotensis]|uniref:Poly-gamma-glutamate biosynthesis protein n=1 Tax=Asanoa iriomotensis TaxID=234613 RepID=A0ABQ4CDT6_9ACTN|nr:poly-gamma-glutamate biosynthesis protein [Asanoa iriomotensis]
MDDEPAKRVLPVLARALAVSFVPAVLALGLAWLPTMAVLPALLPGGLAGGLVGPPRVAGPADSITIAAAGDLLVHPELTAQAAADAGRPDAYDFTKVLAGVAPRIRAADLGICHMETPLAERGGPFTGYPIFSVPPELADAAADAGFDTCSTASNHSLDTGMAGIARTLDNLDRVGIRHTGTARSAVEAAKPTILAVRGVKVAQLSYTFSFNGLSREPGKEWSANLLSTEAVLAGTRQARSAGAEIVVVSLHWGTEYQNEADEGQLGIARELLASPDIDLIVGHHVHVVQPFEKIGDKWVAYGLGNLTTRFPDGSPENTQDAVVAEFTFARVGPGRWKATSASAVPTFMQYQPAARVVDLPAALRSSPASEREDWGRIHRRIVGYLDLLGARQAGLRIDGQS